ncbi:MAG: hypothetical protein J6U98_03725, partial [Abditibacteriota bacterium]|nr:hypothetical protein [Abditibacteriota bacterium]
MKKALICIILIAAAAAAFAQSSSEVGGNNPEIGIVDPDNPVTNDNPVTAEVAILTSIHTSDWLYNPNQIADFK